MALLEVRGVKAGYGRKLVLDGVDFSLSPGELVVLMGPNGSGKTTFVKVVLGIKKPWGGQISLMGKPVYRVRHMIGTVFENITLYPELSPIDNVRIVSDVFGGDPREALKKVGLREDVWKKPVATLSRGMKRKVELARALVHSPRFVVLDEATEGLDPSARAGIYSVLEELKKAGAGILFTSHYLEEAVKIADRVVFLKSGKIVSGREIAPEVSGLRFRVLMADGNLVVMEATPENLQRLIEMLESGDALSASLEGATMEDVFRRLEG